MWATQEHLTFGISSSGFLFSDFVMIINRWIYYSFWKTAADKEIIMINIARAWGMNFKFLIFNTKN